MKNIRPYLIAVPSILCFFVLFLWYQSSKVTEELFLEPVLLTGQMAEGELDLESEESIESVDVESQMIYVDIKGAVLYPNVYALPLGSRLFDVIEMAGGLLPTAATQTLNQSLLLTDQLLIYIYSLDEMESAQSQLGELPLLSGPEVTEATNDSGKQTININQANAAELMTLPGIGPQKAEAILQYRQEYGSFETIEAIMKVSGIGKKTYEQLSLLIAVD